MSTEQELWTTAVHEAGHAVALVVTGGRLTQVRIDGPEDGEVLVDAYPDLIIDTLGVMSAGAWAEWWVFGDIELGGIGEDTYCAMELLRDADPRPDERRIRGSYLCAGHLVGARRDAVLAVARELVRERVLDFARVREICAAHPPTRAPRRDLEPVVQELWGDTFKWIESREFDYLEDAAA